MSQVSDITGIDVLDKALEGAVPPGFAILCQGHPGSGTELFAKQFAAGGTKNQNVVYITTSERTEDIEETMDQLGWKTDMRVVNIGTEYYDNILSKELNISRYRQEGIKLSDVVDFKTSGGIRRDVNFLTMLSYEVVKTKPPFRIVIDSLDFFLEHYDEQKVLSTLLTLRAHAQHYESVVLVTMLKDVYPKRIQSVVEGIVDVILDLETSLIEGSIVHSLLISKVRNHPDKVGAYDFEMTDHGIEVLK